MPGEAEFHCHCHCRQSLIQPKVRVPFDLERQSIITHPVPTVKKFAKDYWSPLIFVKLPPKMFRDWILSWKSPYLSIWPSTNPLYLLQGCTLRETWKFEFKFKLQVSGFQNAVLCRRWKISPRQETWIVFTWNLENLDSNSTEKKHQRWTENSSRNMACFIVFGIAAHQSSHLTISNAFVTLILCFHQF